MDHLVAYVQTSRVTDWKRIALGFAGEAGPVFLYRSDDRGTFRRFAKQGAVLWIIESHKHAPPSLAARLQIAGQIVAPRRETGIEVVEASGRADVPADVLRRFGCSEKTSCFAVGDPDCSRFFGYNDVSGALMKTDFVGKPAPWLGAGTWEPRFGWSLQRPRRIAAGARAVVRFADDLTRRSVFLSWKHRDFETQHERIRRLVRALAASGIDCWWDQLALPPSRALRTLNRSPELLKRLLDYGLDRSRVLLALGSAGWGTPSSRDPARNWTLGEWNRVPVRFACEMRGAPDDGWPSRPDETFEYPVDLSRVVDHIRAYFDGNRGFPDGCNRGDGMQEVSS